MRPYTLFNYIPFLNFGPFMRPVVSIPTQEVKFTKICHHFKYSLREKKKNFCVLFIRWLVPKRLFLRNDGKLTEMTSPHFYALQQPLPFPIPRAWKRYSGAIKGSILQGHIQGQYYWVLHATETGLRSALVLLHRSVPYLAKKLFVKTSIL